MNFRFLVFILVWMIIPVYVFSGKVDNQRASAASHIAKEFASLRIHKVYVPDFCDGPFHPGDLGAFFAATFSELLAKRAKGFVVESRINGHRFLKKSNFTDCDLIRPEVLSKFSSALSVDSVLSANLSVDKDSYSIDFILKDPSGKELFRSNYSEPRYAQTEALFPATSSPSGWPFYFAALDGVTGPKLEYGTDRDSRIAHGMRGIVVISVLVTATGNVDQIRVVHGLKPEIDRAVIKVLKSWRFEPAKDAEGDVVPVRICVAFDMDTPKAPVVVQKWFRSSMDDKSI